MSTPANPQSSLAVSNRTCFKILIQALKACHATAGDPIDSEIDDYLKTGDSSEIALTALSAFSVTGDAFPDFLNELLAALNNVLRSYDWLAPGGTWPPSDNDPTTSWTGDTTLADVADDLVDYFTGRVDLKI